MCEISFVWQVIFYRLYRQIYNIYVDKPFTFGVMNSLILTTRVVGQTDAHGNVRTEYAALIVRNMNGVPLSIAIGHFDANLSLPIMNTRHVTSGTNNASTLELIRQKIIKYLGNNVLSCYDVGW